VRPIRLLSATAHPIPQRERGHTSQQDRRAQQSPRRERRCARRRTRTRPDLAWQVAAHQRIGAGGVAADAVGAEAGHTLRGRSAGAAQGDPGAGGCRGRRRGPAAGGCDGRSFGRGPRRGDRWGYCRGRRWTKTGSLAESIRSESGLRTKGLSSAALISHTR